MFKWVTILNFISVFIGDWVNVIPVDTHVTKWVHPKYTCVLGGAFPQISHGQIDLPSSQPSSRLGRRRGRVPPS